MMPPTTHDDARDSLAALALDALDGAEREAVLAHVAGCAECTRELEALRETAAQVADVVPPARLDDARRAGVRARLLARAAAERGGAVVAPPATPVLTVSRGGAPAPAPVRAPTPRADLRIPPWFGIAASIAVVVLGVWGARVSRDRNELQAELAATRARAARIEQSAGLLVATLAQRDSALRALGGDVVTMRLTTSAEAKQGPRARMYWSRNTDAWVFVANDLPKAPAGRTYQLWLVTGDQKISAGIFGPGPDGTAFVRATYRLTPEQLKAVAVTVEPEGGVDAPTGPIVLVTTST